VLDPALEDPLDDADRRSGRRSSPCSCRFGSGTGVARTPPVRRPRL